MSTWTEITPARHNGSGNAKANIIVGLSSNGGGGRFKQWLAILLRPARMGGVPWLAVGQTVKIERGSVDGREMLRLTPRGAFTVTSAGGVKVAGAQAPVQLRLPALTHQSPDAKPLTYVAYDISAAGNEVLIELPAWACAPGVKVNAVPATAPGAPYRMGAPSHATVLKQNGVVR